MQTSSALGERNGNSSNKSETPGPPVRDICATLRALADMAYRQKQFGYFGALSDARRLLLMAYLPAETCAFCSELLDECCCDQARQADKDDGLFSLCDTSPQVGNPPAAERRFGRRPEEKIPALPFGEAEKMTG